MAETFSLFGLNIYAYGLYAAIGAALLLIGMNAAGRDLPKGTVSVFGVLGMMFGIVLARALYCAVNWNDFAYNYENPRKRLPCQLGINRKGMRRPFSGKPAFAECIITAQASACGVNIDH